jgi:hypothetical protein
MSSDTTKADQKAELERQAAVVAAVDRANAEELPHLGDDNGVPNVVEVVEEEDEAKAPAVARSVTTGPVRTTELARGNDR